MLLRVFYFMKKICHFIHFDLCLIHFSAFFIVLLVTAALTIESFDDNCACFCLFSLLPLKSKMIVITKGSK
jgi:hypothetical protein